MGRAPQREYVSYVVDYASPAQNTRFSALSQRGENALRHLFGAAGSLYECTGNHEGVFKANVTYEKCQKVVPSVTDGTRRS